MVAEDSYERCDEALDSAESIIRYIENIHSDIHDRGKYFERLVGIFLQCDSEQSRLYDKVWAWRDFVTEVIRPRSKSPSSKDIGIDLVARCRGGEGVYHAVQCKYRQQGGSLSKEDINSFVATTLSPPEDWGVSFDAGILFATVRVSRNAMSLFEGKREFRIIDKRRLFDDSDVNWEKVLTENKEERRVPNTLHDYQEEAIARVTEGFASNDRGKLIMACGTGKTLTGLRYMETLDNKGSSHPYLVAMPSIALVAQTMREYCQQSEGAVIHPIPVCSQTIAKRSGNTDFYDLDVANLSHRNTTDPAELAERVQAIGKDERVVLFSTYQSMSKIVEAQRDYGLPAFELIIADEAHRTTGVDRGGDETAFRFVHKRVSAVRRLYMTATPRIARESSRSRAKERGLEIYSMDDEAIYGPREPFYELRFGEAVDKKLLSDYQIVITLVDELIGQEAQNKALAAIRREEEEDGKDGKGKAKQAVTIDIKRAAKFIGLHKAIRKDVVMPGWLEEASSHKELGDYRTPKEEGIDKTAMRRLINYASTIKESQTVARYLNFFKPDASEDTSEGLNITIEHIDGKMRSQERDIKMEFLRNTGDGEACHILTNAKCLTEGIDVPALDGICFFDRKSSVTDIIQAVGRVLRIDPKREKTKGYIVLPICADFDALRDAETIRDTIEKDEDYKFIGRVLRALKAHDMRLLDGVKMQERIKIEVVSDKVSVDRPQPEQLLLNLGDLQNEVMDAIIDIHGTSDEWEVSGKELSKVVKKIQLILRTAIETDKDKRAKFQELLKSFHDNIEKNITETLLIDTLAQHATMYPIFEHLFENGAFQDNPTAKALDDFLALFTSELEAERNEAKFTYSRIKNLVTNKDQTKRKDFIEGFYNKFLKFALPDECKRLGIVYTPEECVDFIIHSTDYLLKEHFNHSIADKDIKILDPFSGMATFITQMFKYLTETSQISNEDFKYKYENDIYISELTLLAHYTGLLRVENAFNIAYKNNDYTAFENAAYGDTFDNRKRQEELSDNDRLKDAGDKWQKQATQDIRVITGNPPYSAGQRDAMDNNKNARHEDLELRIAETYVRRTLATNTNYAYDSYIKALRWSSDRIQEKGIISFIINGSFVDSKFGSGIRACMAEEFSHIYIVNLKGNIRTTGEQQRREGGNIFATASMATIAIIFLIKDGTQGKQPANIRYFAVDDYLKREQKLECLQNALSLKRLQEETLENFEEPQTIIPNKYHSWINQEDEEFGKYIAMGNKKKRNPDYHRSIFRDKYTKGLISCRDIWALNFSEEQLAKNIQLNIDTYNNDKDNPHIDIDNIMSSTDKTKIKYTDALKKSLKQKKPLNFNNNKIRKCLNHPFQIKYVYYDTMLVDSMYKTRMLMPYDDCGNILICTSKPSNPNKFFALATDKLPSGNMGTAGHCYAYYYYEKLEEEEQKSLLASGVQDEDESIMHGWRRRDSITDWALRSFRSQYKDESITRWDIFHYIYGLFHSPAYEKSFANSLHKHYPRIPFVTTPDAFRQFSAAGEQLKNIHLGYETATLYKGTGSQWSSLLDQQLPDEQLYRVNKKMAFVKDQNKNKDKTKIIYNEYLTIHDIPRKAYDYEVDGYSPIEWVMNNYYIKTDKDTRIEQDPNKFSSNPRYIYDLLLRAITISLDTLDIVKSLPPFKITNESEFYSEV